MKAIISKKRYDTETAREIGSHESGNSGDFGHWYETLYLTPGGAFFTVGGGGPASKYAEAVSSNSWGGSYNNFRVLERDEAYEWLENYGDSDTIEEFFGQEIQEA